MTKITRITPASPPEWLAQLDELMLAVFDFSFAGWRSSGGWTDDYACFAIFDGGKAVANVGVYQHDLLVGGVKKRAIQLGAVATHPDWRGRGLSRRILDQVMDRYAGVPAFLSANQSVLDFYTRFGFQQVDDRQPYIDIELQGLSRTLSPLSLEHPKVRASLQRRGCFSNVLDCMNAAPINWFNLLYGYAGNLYHIPSLDVLVVAETSQLESEGILTLVDVISPGPLAFKDLLPHLIFGWVKTIRFGFNPDWLGVSYKLRDASAGGYTFWRGNLNYPPGAMLPLLMKT
jgi:GNAT superfamily N-acetyltransferase